MKNCAPAIFAAAIFTALLVLDLINKNYRDVGFHIAGGIFSVIGLYTACELGGEMMAWILLSIPFVFLIIGLGLIWADSRKEVDPPQQAPTQEPQYDCVACPYCGACPCCCQDKPVEPTIPVPKPSPFGCPTKKV